MARWTFVACTVIYQRLASRVVSGHSKGVSMGNQNVRRDFGLTWKARLAEARDRAATPGPRLSDKEIANLRSAVETLDVSSPENMALLWSGRDIPTTIRLDEADSNSPIWWDKLSWREGEVFRKLGIGFSLEDTLGGEFLANARLNYPEHDSLSAVARNLWEMLSTRFVHAAIGRIEIIAEGAFPESVFRVAEFNALLSNERIMAVNGLDRSLLLSNTGEAFSLLRRWDVERSRRYSEFIASAIDATPYERATAVDDFREAELWYQQDFYEHLGPEGELPALPVEVASAVDQSKDAQAWKYSVAWRTFIRLTGEQQDAAPESGDLKSTPTQ